MLSMQVGIKLVDIMPKTIEEFMPGAASQDIAQIRLDHYNSKRHSKKPFNT